MLLSIEYFGWVLVVLLVSTSAIHVSASCTTNGNWHICTTDTTSAKLSYYVGYTSTKKHTDALSLCQNYPGVVCEEDLCHLVQINSNLEESSVLGQFSDSAVFGSSYTIEIGHYKTNWNEYTHGPTYFTAKSGPSVSFLEAIFHPELKTFQRYLIQDTSTSWKGDNNANWQTNFICEIEMWKRISRGVYDYVLVGTQSTCSNAIDTCANVFGNGYKLATINNYDEEVYLKSKFNIYDNYGWDVQNQKRDVYFGLRRSTTNVDFSYIDLSFTPSQSATVDGHGPSYSNWQYGSAPSETGCATFRYGNEAPTTWSVKTSEQRFVCRRQNTDCMAGMFVNRNNECETCGKGSFTGTKNNLLCTPCTLGETYQDNSGASSCKDVTVCNGGAEITAATLTSDRTCGCPPGTMQSGPSCASCTLGVTYQDEANQDSCKDVTSSCPSGQAVKTAATLTSDRVCGLCSPGTYGHNGICEDCDLGTSYQDATGASSCKPVTMSCPPGQSTTKLPTLSTDRKCGSCGAGTREVDGVCVDCVLGLTYQNDAGETSCKNVSSCSPGYGEAVPPTLFSNRVCTPCSPGTQGVDGSCISCFLGFTFQNNFGKETCEATKACNPGSVSIQEPTLTSDRQCTSCIAGTFEEDGECVACESNTYQNLEGQTSCIAQSCPAGEQPSESLSKLRAVACEACPVNTYKTSNTISTCSAVSTCVAGEYVMVDSTSSSDRECGNCVEEVSFSTMDNAAMCTPATVCGFFEEQTAPSNPTTDTECTSCLNGEEYFDVGLAKCVSISQGCPDGTYLTSNATQSSDIVCSISVYECENNVNSQTNAACTCPSNDACVKCVRHEFTEEMYGVVLRLVNKVPSYSVKIGGQTTIQHASGVDPVAKCNTRCSETMGCAAFIVRDSGSYSECDVLEQFDESTTVGSVGSRMFAPPRCDVCLDGFVSNGTGCAFVHDHPLFNITALDSIVTIPQSLAIGSMIATISATSLGSGMDGVLSYALLNAAKGSFSIDGMSGTISVSSTLSNSEQVVVEASDGRSHCNSVDSNGVLVTTDGGCTSTYTLNVKVAQVLNCPRDTSIVVPPNSSPYQFLFPSVPSLPLDIEGYTLELVVDGTSVGAPVSAYPIGVGETVFRVQTTTSIGGWGALSCGFSVNLKYGITIIVDTLDVKSTPQGVQSFILSSIGLANAKPFPSFSTTLQDPFSFQLQPKEETPINFNIPTNYTGVIAISASWCTDLESFDPTSVAENAKEVGTLTMGVQGTLSDSEFNFFDGGSFVVVDGTRTCLVLRGESNVLRRSFVADAITITFSPDTSARRRRVVDTPYDLFSSFPSYVFVEISNNGSSSGETVDAGLKLVDETPPSILNCPPVDNRVYSVTDGSPRITLSLPQFFATDFVDTSPTVDVVGWVFDGATSTYSLDVSVVNSPVVVVVEAMDASNNKGQCIFDVDIVVTPVSFYSSLKVGYSSFPVARKDVALIGRSYISQVINPTTTSTLFNNMTTFSADFESYNELHFTFSSPTVNEPFVIRSRLDSFGGRLLVDLKFGVDGVFGSTGAPLSDAAVFIRFGSFTPAAGGDGVLTEYNKLDGASVSIDLVNGIVDVSGFTSTFNEEVRFTTLSVIVRYASLPSSMMNVGNANWVLSAESSVAVEYQYHVSVAAEVVSETTSFGFLVIYDNQNPTFLQCPEEIVKETLPGKPYALATYNVIPQDNRDVSQLVVVTEGQASGAKFYLRANGTSAEKVKVTAVDPYGNVGVCEFEVIVEDKEAPIVYDVPHLTEFLPADPDKPGFVGIDGRQFVSMNVSDNSLLFGSTESWRGAMLNTIPEAFAYYGLGLTSVPIEFIDDYGNAKEVVATVNVVDALAPVLNCPEMSHAPILTPLNGASALVFWSNAYVVDNSGEKIVAEFSSQSGDEFRVGDHVILVNASDLSGNVARCNFTFSVEALVAPHFNVTNSTAAVQNMASTSLIAGAGAAGVLLLLVVVIALVVIRRLRNRFKEPQNWEEIFQLMDTFSKIDGDGPRVPRELSRSAVRLIEELGRGAFGIVSKGILQENPVVPGYLTAVKSTLEKATLADRQELMEEAAVMAQFDNDYIVKLIGVVTVGQPALVVLEFMEYGALKPYLEEHDVSEEQKIMWAGDCSEGMEHIHSKGFIHRDVAARNVLLSSEMRCKIADFGLAREQESDSAYYRSRGGNVPVRWTAAEALDSHKFSECTDVWSSGVLFNEIWTRAELPYKGWSNQKVWVEVQAGSRLAQPTGCRDVIYQKFLECWDVDGASRPTFTELKIFWRNLYFEETGIDLNEEKTDGYIDVDVKPTRSSFLGSLVKRVGSRISLKGSRKPSTSSLAPARKMPGFDEGDDLYDMGDDNNNNNNNANERNENEELYDMGDDIGFNTEASTSVPIDESLYSLQGNGEVDDDREGEEATEEALYDMGEDAIMLAPTKQAEKVEKKGDEKLKSKGFLVNPLYDRKQQSIATTAVDELYDNNGPDDAFGFGDFAGRALGEVSELDVGKRVIVQGYSCEGTLRFFGKHMERGTQRCGVELDDAVGKNNGTVSGHVYFKCKDLCGVLCKPNKVAVLDSV
eukprot:m.125036 g.125036  ORF g.125036 m.125036 type:complete len:2563 (+) comp9427_c1_seq8:916-8604(+)